MDTCLKVWHVRELRSGAGTIQPIKKSAANVAMNKKNAPFPSATQSEYKQMIEFWRNAQRRTDVTAC